MSSGATKDLLVSRLGYELTLVQVRILQILWVPVANFRPPIFASLVRIGSERPLPARNAETR